MSVAKMHLKIVCKMAAILFGGGVSLITQEAMTQGVKQLKIDVSKNTELNIQMSIRFEV